MSHFRTRLFLKETHKWYRCQISRDGNESVYHLMVQGPTLIFSKAE